MGFIERLREERLREEAKRQAQEERQKQALRPSRPIESLGDREARSRKYYEESGCRDLVSELANVLGASVDLYESHPYANEPNSSTKEIIEDFQLNLKRTKPIWISDQSAFWGRAKSYKGSGVGSYPVFLRWRTNERK